MRKRTLVWVAIAVFLAGASGGTGQILTGVNTDNTLTIGVTGAATAPADWVDVNLAVKAEGVNLREALAASTATCRNAINELVALGIAEENIRIGPPKIASADFAQMVAGMEGGADQPKPSVTRSLTVRFPIVDRETVWEDAFTIIDVAADAGATPGGEAAMPFMPQMFSSGEPLAFGVDDTETLRSQAIANGLQQARGLADGVAAGAGKAIKGVSAVTVQEYAANPMMAMVTMVGAEPVPGEANYQVGLSVTYALE